MGSLTLLGLGGRSFINHGLLLKRCVISNGTCHNSPITASKERRARRIYSSLILKAVKRRHEEYSL